VKRSAVNWRLLTHLQLTRCNVTEKVITAIILNCTRLRSLELCVTANRCTVTVTSYACTGFGSRAAHLFRTDHRCWCYSLSGDLHAHRLLFASRQQPCDVLECSCGRAPNTLSILVCVYRLCSGDPLRRVLRLVDWAQREDKQRECVAIFRYRNLKPNYRCFSFLRQVDAK